MLDTIKELFNIKDSNQDELLSFYINLVEDEIKNYCNIDSIPKGLENLKIRMVIDVYNREFNNVSSIKRGDTQIVYINTNNIIDKSFVKDYYLQLNQFKRLRTL